MQLQQQNQQQLNARQLQGVELLQLSSFELEQYLRELALENPLIESVESSLRIPDDALPHTALSGRYPHSSYAQDEEYDPLFGASCSGGLEETLPRFLSRQLFRLGLNERTEKSVQYLIACLDDDGYLRIPLDDLTESTGLCASELSEAIDILRSLEPAGVGASSLRECLALQLNRIGHDGLALSIVNDYLPLLAKKHYDDIAKRLNVSVSSVKAATNLIRELDPKPGYIFSQPEHIPYLFPDLRVEQENGRLIVRSCREDRPYFQISAYYRKLLLQTDDRNVKEYLTSKLQQAETLQYLISQRQSTLLRCAQVIVDRQSAFFFQGELSLQSLRLSDIAEETGLHESTVSRAIREKYLQFVRGIYPLSYFLSRSATTGSESMGGAAARALLVRVIQSEDKLHPLSDQAISERMSREGCPVSRRTVAKYRNMLGLPDASGRKHG